MVVRVELEVSRLEVIAVCLLVNSIESTAKDINVMRSSREKRPIVMYNEEPWMERTRRKKMRERREEKI